MYIGTTSRYLKSTHFFCHFTDIFSVKRVLKDMRKEQPNWSPQGGLMEGSGRVVLTAVAM